MSSAARSSRAAKPSASSSAPVRKPFSIARYYGSRIEIKVLTWNIFHGRDAPPDRSLYTRRAEWTRRTERNETHVQVNRNLFREYSALLSKADWDVALLQECPPRWGGKLARACDAELVRALTSRNWFLPLTSAVAWFSPDLVGSSEGGSNAILVRRRAGGVVERRATAIRALRPERRTMAFAKLGCGLCVSSLHASTSPPRAEVELIRAAQRATGWAEGQPLILGGDFNVRPHSSKVYAELEKRFGLRGPTAGDSIDHLLVLGAEVVSPARTWPAEDRELEEHGLKLRLSDHAPVELELRIT